MILRILFVSMILILSSPVFSQCWKLDKGQTVEVSTTIWANTLPYTEKKWAKMKQSQRDELVMKLNKSIEDGLAPYSVTKVTLKVTDLESNAGTSALTLEAFNAGFEYKTTNYCTSDTVYQVRNSDVVYSILKDDTLGLAIQGVQRLPIKLAIGTILPSYRDYMITIPKTWTKNIMENVKSFSYTTKEDGGMGWGQDRDGDYGYGQLEKTVRHDIYKTVNHKVNISEQIENLTIHYFIAVVTATEEITMEGQTVTAYVIESESWTKGGLIRNYETEDQRMQTKMNSKAQKLKEKMDKKAIKRGYLNEDGYAVQYRKEWFIPGYGVVRSETYDQYGAIQTRSFVNW